MTPIIIEVLTLIRRHVHWAEIPSLEEESSRELMISSVCRMTPESLRRRGR